MGILKRPTSLVLMPETVEVLDLCLLLSTFLFELQGFDCCQGALELISWFDFFCVVVVNCKFLALVILNV